MRVLTCLVEDHNHFLLLAATFMCMVGAKVTISLFRRAAATSGTPRYGWNFLTAVCAGSSIWATHFIAMLGYQPGAPVTFDPVLTLASILIAIIGTGIGFAVAAGRASPATTVLGGGIIGLSIAAMHYAGMFAYRVEGPVSWDQTYIIVSIGLSAVLSIACIGLERGWSSGRRRHLTPALLVAAIVSLHFTGMAAFTVTPVAGLEGAGSEAFRAMALSVLIAGLIVVGTGISSYLIDDRTRASSDARLRRMAYQDPLTGLANRRALQMRLDASLVGTVAVDLLLIDLDRFKSVNDTFGHAIGDKLLVEAARRIEAVIGPTGFAARMGGDELAVLLDPSIFHADAVAAEIVDAIAEPFALDDHVVVAGCSIGVCHGADAEDAESLMQRADIALYEAKRLGRSRAFRYEPGMLEAVAARKRLDADMRGAIAAGEFRLVYQPIVNVVDGAVLGHEALIRWDHPTRGLVSPVDFIPMAEENGCIVAIGNWVLETACRQAAQWDNDIFVAVNVSAAQFHSPLLLAHVTHALAVSGLHPGRLEIELTETAIVADGAHVAHILGALRILGIRIAMDDFGTGYSSLAHLRDLPLDRIKIDRSFVASAGTDPNSMAVLKAITQLGRDMGIQTLGEGVETIEQMQLLRSLGCDAMQGYYIGMPQRGADMGKPAMALPA